jgi:hypothetical protein
MENMPRVSYFIVELSIPFVLVVWRMVVDRPIAYLKDWILIAGVFWIYTLLQSKSKHWPMITMTVMAYLLGIYLMKQIPHALAVLRI